MAQAREEEEKEGSEVN